MYFNFFPRIIPVKPGIGSQKTKKILIMENRDQESNLGGRKNIFIYDFKVIGIDKIIDTEVFAGIEQENFLIECEKRPADPKPVFFGNDEIVNICIFVRTFFRK